MRNKWLLPLLVSIMVIIAVYTSSTTLEMAATTSGLLCVWLTARENMWAWPIGLINVACFFVMFGDAKLYADMTLQVLFFVLSIYGWIIWMTQRAGAQVRPTKRITPRTALLLGLALITVTLLWGFVLQTYTDASIPYMDAFIATLSVIAQYLLSSKVLENWLVWIVVDILSIGMYAYKELYTVAFLYLIFLAIAITGYVSWKKEFQRMDRRNPLCQNAKQA